MHPSRSRLAPLAFAAALALGACGGGDDVATDTVPPADSTDSTDAGLLAPRAVRTAGGGSAALSAGAEAAPAPGDKMASDMMMPYRIVTFVAGDGLVLPTNAIGYGFEAGATVTAEQVAALASELGVTGAPERIDDGFSAYWRVGPDDGSAPSLWVYEDAQLSWSYSSAWADTPVASSGCAIAEPGVAVAPSEGGGESPVTDVAVVPPSDPVTPDCVEPEPPVGVPSQADAEAKAREVMTAVGLDPAGFEFETYADEWFASSSATEQLDGAFAGRTFSAGFGAEGVLQYASGQLAEPVKVGPYPLIDLDTAIARLNDPSGFYGGFGPALGMADVARVDAVGAAEPAIAVEPAPGAVAGGARGDAAMPIDSMPPVSVPEPEEVTVTLVDVEADVWWAYDVDGSVWLLPAYRFIGDDGGWYTVPAVTDEFLVQVPADEAPTPEPMPIEPMPVESLPVEVQPGDVPTESFPEDSMEIFDTSVLEPSVGKTLAEFTADAETLGATVRVIEIDGVMQPVTADYSTTRVNVAVTGEGDAATVDAILNVG